MPIIMFMSAILLLAVSPAHAGPSCAQHKAEVLFHCKIKGSSREVTICDLPDKQYLYRYGKPGKPPEMQIQSAQNEVVYTPWNGIGNSNWARLGFRNKGYLYDVGRSIQKGGETPPEGFIDIFEPGNDEPIATKFCETGTVEGDLDALWDRFN